MSLKYKSYFLKSTWVSIFLVTSILLGLYQIMPYSTSFPLFQTESNEAHRVDLLSRTPDTFNDFGVEIKSESSGQSLTLQSKIDIQVVLTIYASVEDLHLEWALKQDVNITKSELPTESISFESQQASPIEYNAEVQITGDRPHIIVQAYTLGDKGEKIGESAELYFNYSGSQFLPNTLLENKTKIKIDPSKIIR